MPMNVFRRMALRYRLSKARAAARSGNWGKAAKQYRQLVAITPDVANIWIQYGHALRETGDVEGASAAYDRVLTKYDGNADAHLQLGHIARSRGDVSAAVQHYADALRINGNVSDARVALSELGCADEVIESLSGSVAATDRLHRSLSTLHSRLAQQDALIAQLRNGQQARFAELSSRLDQHDARIGRQDEAAERSAHTIASSREAVEASINGVDQRLAIFSETLFQASERSDRFDGRLHDLYQQMAGVLDHISVGRAQGYELVRQKRIIDEMAADILATALSLAKQADDLSGQREALEHLRSRSATIDALATRIKALDEHRGELDQLHMRVQSLDEQRDTIDQLTTRMKALNEHADAIEQLGTRMQTLDERGESFDQLAIRVGAIETSNYDAARYAILEKAIGAHASALLNLETKIDEAKAAAASRDDQAVNAAIESLEGRVQEIDSRPTAAPVPEDTLRAVHELERREQQNAQMLNYLNSRVEFVRRELMFEYRYNRSGADFGENLVVEPKILNEAKLEAAREADAIRLNVGCGHVQQEGYINVDRRELPGVDILADADRLPFAEEEVAEISSSHMLEHFPQESFVRDLLPYWSSVLRPGGRLHAVVPDGQAMLIKHVNEDYPFDQLREVLYGAQDYSGDFHYNIFTPDSLTKIFQGHGFVNVRVIDAGRRNGLCYEFEIEAFKGTVPA